MKTKSSRHVSRASTVLMWVSYGVSLLMFGLVTMGMFVGLAGTKVASSVWPSYYPMLVGMGLHTVGIVGSTVTRRFSWWFFALALLGALVMGAHGLTLFRELSNTTVYAGGMMTDFSVWDLIYRHLIPVVTSALLGWRIYARAHAESKELAREIAQGAKESKGKRIFKD